MKFFRACVTEIMMSATCCVVFVSVLLLHSLAESPVSTDALGARCLFTERYNVRDTCLVLVRRFFYMPEAHKCEAKVVSGCRQTRGFVSQRECEMQCAPLVRYQSSISPVCSTTTECADGNFCLKNTDNCHGSGGCTQVPQICTLNYLPVCGCDGNSYSNECGAHASGVSVAHEGECLNASSSSRNQ